MRAGASRRDRASGLRNVRGQPPAAAGDRLPASTTKSRRRRRGSSAPRRPAGTAPSALAPPCTRRRGRNARAVRLCYSTARAARGLRAAGECGLRARPRTREHAARSARSSLATPSAWTRFTREAGSDRALWAQRRCAVRPQRAAEPASRVKRSPRAGESPAGRGDARRGRGRSAYAVEPRSSIRRAARAAGAPRRRKHESARHGDRGAARGRRRAPASTTAPCRPRRRGPDEPLRRAST